MSTYLLKEERDDLKEMVTNLFGPEVCYLRVIVYAQPRLIRGFNKKGVRLLGRGAPGHFKRKPIPFRARLKKTYRREIIIIL